MTESELLRRLDQTIERNSEIIEENQQIIGLNARAFRQLVQSHKRLERTVDDLRDQIAANTQALLRLIDWLGPEPGVS